ncbi:hypothetical protein SAMN05518863_103417 [Candidatus Pantoea symbiotica]|jgi:hypothetical protein|uniref:Uncharacterized protein n=1 Tax=Candidatus Pantoea symbiotica TaxID=1884370 RepID=A0A1I3VHJ7_9GAMM|nr:hypothetical protein SAMN05518863_103417 [Pantoea symbiotica]SFU65553.1 hypothetical protein SAMN05518864_103417 [Pantoea sp. YR525]
MSKPGLHAFHVICARPIEKIKLFPVVIFRNKSNQLSGWRLNKTQRDFILSLYEIEQEKK